MTASPVRLNHAVLFVADLDRATHFYTEVFGMQLVAREDRFNAVFLRLPRSGNHHDLGLFGAGPGAAPKRRGGIGLYHLAWQVDTIDELVEFRERLIESGARSPAGPEYGPRGTSSSTPPASSPHRPFGGPTRPDAHRTRCGSHRVHTRACGSTRRRPRGIGLRQSSQMPYVPSDMRRSAPAMSAMACREAAAWTSRVCWS
jgi:catechol 2,3-dioxygenase-like lactoylglutathione lyase family enzyme